MTVLYFFSENLLVEGEVSLVNGSIDVGDDGDDEQIHGYLTDFVGKVLPDSFTCGPFRGSVLVEGSVFETVGVTADCDHDRGYNSRPLSIDVLQIFADSDAVLSTEDEYFDFAVFELMGECSDWNFLSLDSLF